MNGAPPPKSFIEIVPDHQTVRERLGQLLREVKILRKLLKVSESAAVERQRQREVKRVG